MSPLPQSFFKQYGFPKLNDCGGCSHVQDFNSQEIKMFKTPRLWKGLVSCLKGRTTFPVKLNLTKLGELTILV